MRFVYQYPDTNLRICLESNQCLDDDRQNHKNRQPCHHYIWELPVNYRYFMVVMVFYLFCRRTKRILVTAITGFKIHILIQSLILFIYENNWVKHFWNYYGTLYMYIHIKIVICNGNLFSWSHFFFR